MTTHALMELADRVARMTYSPEDLDQIESFLRTAAAEGGAVYATVTGLTSEDGKHELYTITDEPFPLSDPWKLYIHPPTDSGDGRDGERYRHMCLMAWQNESINKGDMDDEVDASIARYAAKTEASSGQ